MPEPEFVDHPLIKPNAIAKRLYQETIIGTAVKWNTLVVLPTGVGKTVIAILAAAYQLRRHPQTKCVILAPTGGAIPDFRKWFHWVKSQVCVANLTCT